MHPKEGGGEGAEEGQEPANLVAMATAMPLEIMKHRSLVEL